MKQRSAGRTPQAPERKQWEAPPSAETIRWLAGRVMAGQVVEAALTDGTFSRLMDELRQRGMTMQPRDEKSKHLKPFLFHVGSSSL